MKLHVKKSSTSATTNPKLPIEPNACKIPQETKMKFNWRANWEILLVLVIIVVGIVITTIAAIRSKDKHLLVLPEETDYGQLLAGGGSSSEQIAPVPPLQQTDFQLQQNAQVLTNADDELGTTTRRPPPPRTKASQRNSTGHHHHHNQHHQHNHNQLRLDHHQHLSSNAAARARPDGKHNQHHLNQHQQHHSKHDDAGEGGESSFLGPSGADQKHLAFGGSTSASHDNYDALSTEATPSQVRSEANDDSRQLQAPHLSRHSAHGRQQNSTRHQHKDNLAPPETTPDPLMDEPIDGIADDFHTTRSSLANSRPNQHHNHHHHPHHAHGNNSSRASGTQATGVTIPAPLFDQPGGPMSITPALPMHGPYGVTPPTLLNTHQFNSNVQLQALLAQHASNNKLEPPILEQDDMMTSYSRMPSAANLTEALIRDYNLASALGNGPNSTSTLAASFFSTGGGGGGGGETGASSQDGPSQSGSSSSTGTRNRMHSAALPFSVLLNDLIKFTRPSAATTTNSSPPQQQGTFEQPANSRPQHQSILQQLRSLPGPLLALLQGSSVPSGAVHESSSGSSSSSPSPSSSSPSSPPPPAPPASHDASESSPHYQRISMSPTEMHSILTRSLRSTGVLPAFPAPKDVPDSWIPPTSGGNPAVHEAMNSNADFVASNVAGFVRAPGQQQQASSSSSGSSASGGSGGPHQASEQNQYHQAAQVDGANHIQQDGNIGGISQQQQTPNQPHFISIEQHQRLQAQQSYGQQQQQQQQQQQPIQPQPSDNNRQDYQPMHHQPAQMGQFGQTNNGGAQMRGATMVAPQMMLMNQRPIYSSRPVSEIPVPLGYNPSMLMQQQQQQSFAQVPQPQPIRRALEFAIPVESAPKASITSSVVSSITNNNNNNNNKQTQQVGVAQQPGKLASQAAPLQLNTVNRQKREALDSSGSSSSSPRMAVAEIEMAASRDNPSEEEEFLDSRPVSIVRPDGRPMNGDIHLGVRSPGAWKGGREGYTSLEHQSGRAGEADLSSPSQRKVNHMDFDALNYYASSYKRQNNQKLALSPYGKHNIPKKKKKKLIDHYKRTKLGRYDKKTHSGLALDAAGSGLMSKLLGTASTNDDVEEDIDADDEDSANERRKEELEDAEFGLVNDDRNSLQQPEGSPPSPAPAPPSGSTATNPGADGNEIGRANNDEGANNDASHLGSGSTDSEAYARRNQQRSDIEFYGHPGEETRQLKYGILGSGNYEVVNGGIYPEADESTAAVNSVANYVRKPGLLVAGLPKLMGHHSQHHQQAAAAFMPGGRIGVVGGYMRDASATPDDLVGHLVPTVDGNKVLASPLLDLIDANGGGGGHLFDPSLVAHLGSSGTSARTTHTSQEDNDQDAGNGKKPGKRKHHHQQQHQIGNSLDGNNDEVKKPVDGETDNENDNNDAAAAVAGYKSNSTSKPKKSSKGKLQKFKTSMNEQQQYVAEFNDPNTNEQDTRSSSIDSNRQALNNDYIDNNNHHHHHEDNINHHTDNDGDRHRLESKSRDDDYRARKQAANLSGSSKSPHGTNQFNSYQILPSKKVTIYSDQDLDSAPSDPVGATSLAP